MEHQSDIGELQMVMKEIGKYFGALDGSPEAVNMAGQLM